MHAVTSRSKRSVRVSRMRAAVVGVQARENVSLEGLILSLDSRNRICESKRKFSRVARLCGRVGLKEGFSGVRKPRRLVVLAAGRLGDGLSSYLRISSTAL
jgi:hypothetical protein